jgi:hypothetical protein
MLSGSSVLLLAMVYLHRCRSLQGSAPVRERRSPEYFRVALENLTCASTRGVRYVNEKSAFPPGRMRAWMLRSYRLSQGRK